MACFADINVSQGSVETYARFSGIFNIHLSVNLQRNLPVKKILKSVMIWQNYGHESVAQFFGPPCTFVTCAIKYQWINQSDIGSSWLRHRRSTLSVCQPIVTDALLQQLTLILTLSLTLRTITLFPNLIFTSFAQMIRLRQPEMNILQQEVNFSGRDWFSLSWTPIAADRPMR